MKLSLVEYTSDQIINLIMERGLQVGDKLPVEMELAEILSVSRGTVREAVKLLKSRNVLDVFQGAGTFVSGKKGVPVDPLGITFMKDEKHVAIDLLDIRLMLEPEVSAMAALQRTPQSVGRLHEQCEIVEQLILQGEEYWQEDICFHKRIAQCTENSVAHNLIPIVTSSMYLTISATANLNSKSTIREHRIIAESIQRGDHFGARNAMMQHLMTNRASLIDNMREQESLD